MALEVYRRKRHFDHTPEPHGRHVSGRGGFHYVIQKHAARRLHYDFRLELDGALKSWAVPKGPSLDPSARRLAVHVEDHPLEYGKFEGTIPKPQYGAGTVMVWDRGTWRPEGDPREGYRHGHLRFKLNGKKLHGTWDLVRTGKRDDSDRENWLLIKSKDEYATDIDVVEALPDSAQSGRNLEQIAAGKKRVAKSSHRKTSGENKKSKAPAERRRRERTTLPSMLKPQLATLVEKAPTGKEWVHEVKYDGYRVLCRLQDGRARLYTRNGLELTSRMGAIAKATEQLTGFGDAWLDGEVVVQEADGRSSFSALQQALSEKHDQDMMYYIFDLPYVNGNDISAAPLLERKLQLAKRLRAAHAPRQLRYSDHSQGHGDLFHSKACEFGLEGLVSKRVDAPYRGARTHTWVKTKCRLRQEFVVGGYSDPGGTRKGFGALLLGVYDQDGQLHYCGRTGSGFNDALLRSLHPKLTRLEQKKSPFAETLSGLARKGAHWVRPALVAEVEFTSWTRDGMVRQAAFQGLREDKRAQEIVREIAQSLPVSADRNARVVEPAAAPALPPKTRLTNANKILYPEQGLTKADLASYYAAVADWVLPPLARRPLTLLRCPEGRKEHCFFQKHAVDGTPPELLRVLLKEGMGKNGAYLALDSIEGVLALVQMGVLEIHVWGSHIDKPEQPDILVFDLDPDPKLPWKDTIDAVALVRARLIDLGLTPFVRTTGGKGLHVVVPVARRREWPEIKAFTKAVAEDIARQDPQRYTTRLPLAGRRGKIFIDYLRNGRGATAITSYSTRARPDATVAVPLTWQELKPSLDPKKFTLRSVPARLQALKRDPWKDFTDAAVAISDKMMRAVGTPRR